MHTPIVKINNQSVRLQAETLHNRTDTSKSAKENKALENKQYCSAAFLGIS
jgi:hypothetical protein